MKFSLLTIGGRTDAPRRSHFGFYLHSVDQISEAGRIFELTSSDIAKLNPNTQTCPVFRNSDDAELTKLIYRRVPSFQVEGESNGDPWKLQLARLFMMDSDSDRFISPKSERTEADLCRLYESKLMHHFDHRFATFLDATDEDLRSGQASETIDRSPSVLTASRFLVPRPDTESRYRRADWGRPWSVALRDITNSTNERTVITCIIPREAAANNLPLILSLEEAGVLSCLCAALNSFALDYVSRQKVGGTHVNLYLLQQFPIHPPTTYAQPCPWTAHPQSTIHDPPTLRDWLLPRVLELTYTAWDLEAFAADCGWSGPPFRWDEDRRFLLRCELDAAFFHLYLGSEDEWRQQPEALTRAFPTPRHAVSYIMDTFPIVKRKDESKHGTYRTKTTILQIYDALGESIAAGQPYQTLLNPPPADPECCHPAHPRTKTP